MEQNKESRNKPTHIWTICFSTSVERQSVNIDCPRTTEQPQSPKDKLHTSNHIQK